MARTRATADNLGLNIAAFSRHLDAEGKSQATIVAYRKGTDQLEAFLREQNLPLGVAAIRAEHIERFLIDLRERGQAAATINQRFRSLQQFWKYLEAEGEVKATPLENIAPPRVPDNPPPIVAEDQMRAILRTCDGTTFTDRRDTAILWLFYDTGIRRAEMAGITVADLDTEMKSIEVTGKGERTRVVRYGRDASRVLDRYLRRRDEHPDGNLAALWLGQRGSLSIYGVEQVVQRRAGEANLGHIHCHSFRHSFAHNYLEAGGNEGNLMHLAGWRSRQMVDRYGRSAAAQRARDTYDAFSPGDRLRKV